MRFIIIIAVIVIAAILGLFLYGQMLEPDTRVIEQDAYEAGNA